MRFEGLGGQVFILDACLNGHDLASDNRPGIDPSKQHSDQIEDTDASTGCHRLDPQPEVTVEDRQKDQKEDKGEDRHNA
jgi:hypothetical protein